MKRFAIHLVLVLAISACGSSSNARSGSEKDAATSSGTAGKSASKNKQMDAAQNHSVAGDANDSGTETKNQDASGAGGKGTGAAPPGMDAGLQNACFDAASGRLGITAQSIQYTTGADATAIPVGGSLASGRYVLTQYIYSNESCLSSGTDYIGVAGALEVIAGPKRSGTIVISEPTETPIRSPGEVTLGAAVVYDYMTTGTNMTMTAKCLGTILACANFGPLCDGSVPAGVFTQGGSSILIVDQGDHQIGFTEPSSARTDTGAYSATANEIRLFRPTGFQNCPNVQVYTKM